MFVYILPKLVRVTRCGIHVARGNCKVYNSADKTYNDPKISRKTTNNENISFTPLLLIPSYPRMCEKRIRKREINIFQ